MKALEGCDLLVNLAGRSVNCRYHRRNREEILRSRVESTRILGVAVNRCARPPAVWMNSGSATIYRHAEDCPMDEEAGEIGHGFSVEVCLAWEAEFKASQALQNGVGPRKVILRSAMVMGPGRDGVFEAFHGIVKRGLGGTLGDGRQKVSWIHMKDWFRAIEWIWAHENLEGAINLSAPHPLPNREFMAVLRKVSAQPIGLPASRWMLEVGALALRTETELLLKSRWVLPSRLLKSGFVFRYPDFETAAREIVGQKAEILKC